jgi:hypothetical protein
MTRTKQKSGLMVKDGVLMFQGSAEDASIDLRKVLEQDREERIRHVAEAAGFTGSWDDAPEDAK